MRQKGAYILVLELRKDISLNIKALGKVQLAKGMYAYVGSAWGPGGLKARICRHIKKRKKLFWHIDYLTQLDVVEPLVAILFLEQKIESKLAELLSQYFSGIPRFGSTDTKDFSHLFLIDNLEKLLRILREENYKFIVVDFNESDICSHVSIPDRKTSRNLSKQ